MGSLSAENTFSEHASRILQNTASVCWIFQKLFILEGFNMGEVTFLVHMHKHGFFIPDVEFLVDPKGFLAYLGLKVKRYYMCLYCNGGCILSVVLKQFRSISKQKIISKCIMVMVVMMKRQN